MSFVYKMKSDYSFLSSTITIDDAISFCKTYKLDSFALIDNNLHGSLQFYYSCINANIKPIIGIEVKVKYKEEIYPLVLIAKNENGFKNISYISTSSYNSFIEFKNLSNSTHYMNKRGCFDIKLDSLEAKAFIDYKDAIHDSIIYNL